MTVEIRAAEAARIRVLRTAPRVSASRNSSRYQLSEKPENTERLFASLKENTSSIAIGAKRKIIMIAVYTFAAGFILLPSLRDYELTVGKALHERHTHQQNYHQDERDRRGKVQVVRNVLPLDSVAYQIELAVAELL